MITPPSRRALGRLLGVDRGAPMESLEREGYSPGRRALAGLLGVRLTEDSMAAPSALCAPGADGTNVSDQPLTDSGSPSVERTVPPFAEGLLELVRRLFGLLVSVLLAVAYVSSVAAYFVFVAPLVATAAALYVVGDLAVGYFQWVHGVLVRRAPELEVVPPSVPRNDPEPAYRQYFFGPAMRDLRQIIILAWQRGRTRVATQAVRFTALTLTASARPVAITWPVGFSLWAGLICGAVLGGVLVGALTVVYASVVLCMQLTVRACVGVLRPADNLMLHARRIPGMRCPWCYEKNSYPAYRCQNCRRLHHDMHPGRYGVLRRRCSCGAHMPTLALLGSYRLPAYCVYCDHQMSDETGHSRGVVLPLIGGRAAGKTRLMAAMLVSLTELADGGGLHLANAETRAAFQMLSTVLDAGGRIPATTTELPHAHSVQLRIGRHTRLVHIFDPAGERLVDRARIEELRYLQEARTFLFVLDPMSVPAFWDSLTDADRSALDRTLASRVHPQLVFDQVVQEVIAMGADLRKSRLAVAISKTDLIEHTGLFGGRVEGDEWARWWLASRLGLGSLVRSMDSEFREVRFFFTAAVTVAPRHAHESIAPLVAWSLGISPPDRHRAAVKLRH